MSYVNENKQLFDSGRPADIFRCAHERDKQRESVLCTFCALSKLYDPSVPHVYVSKDAQVGTCESGGANLNFPLKELIPIHQKFMHGSWTIFLWLYSERV